MPECACIRALIVCAASFTAARTHRRRSVFGPSAETCSGCASSNCGKSRGAASNCATGRMNAPSIQASAVRTYSAWFSSAGSSERLAGGKSPRNRSSARAARGGKQRAYVSAGSRGVMVKLAFSSPPGAMVWIPSLSSKARCCVVIGQAPAGFHAEKRPAVRPERHVRHAGEIEHRPTGRSAGRCR